MEQQFTEIDIHSIAIKLGHHSEDWKEALTSMIPNPIRKITQTSKASDLLA